MKRWLAATAAGIWTLGAAPAMAQATFHGNAARTGVYDSAGPRDAATVLWRFPTGGPIVTSPVLADGVVYIASLDGHLHAIDQESGKEKWKFKSRAPIASSPAVADGIVYFVSTMGSLAAIDAATGQPRWVFAAEYERRFEAKGMHGYQPAAQTMPDAWDVFKSSPAVANGKVYFGSGDGSLYAVDAKSGVLQWKYATRGVVHSSPAIAGNLVFVGSWDSALYAVDAESGQERWRFQAGEDPAIHNQEGFQSSPAVVDGVVYVGCRDAHVYALDAATGKKRWDYPTSKSWVIGTPAVRDGVVYVGTSDSRRFMALDAKTGRLRFNAVLGGYVFSSAALAGDRAYVGSHNGTLYALDTRDGRIAWQLQTDGAKKDPLKVLSPDGSLNPEAFAPVFGDFGDMYIDFYRFVSAGGIMSSPAVDRGTVFVGSLDGTLYAIR